MARKDISEGKEPLYFDIMPPHILARLHRYSSCYTFNNVIHYLGRVAPKNLSIPYEDHERMLKALEAINTSYEKISTRAMRQATGQSLMRKADVYEEFLSARLPSGEAALEAYKLAYQLADKMNGTPLLRAQREGDYGGLAELVRRGRHMSPEASDYVANLLTRSGPTRAVRKPPSADTARRHRTIVWWILRARRSGTGTDASYSAAAEKFDCSERWVRKIFSEHRTGESELMDKAEQLIEQLECFVKFLREHEPK